MQQHSSPAFVESSPSSTILKTEDANLSTVIDEDSVSGFENAEESPENERKFISTPDVPDSKNTHGESEEEQDPIRSRVLSVDEAFQLLEQEFPSKSEKDVCRPTFLPFYHAVYYLIVIHK